MNFRFVLASIGMAAVLAFVVSLTPWVGDEWLKIGVFAAVIAAVLSGANVGMGNRLWMLGLGVVLGLAAWFLWPTGGGNALAYNALWAAAIGLVATFTGGLAFARPGPPPASMRRGH